MSLSVINTLAVCFSILLNIHLAHLLITTWHISFIKNNVIHEMQPLHNNCFGDHTSVVQADFRAVSMFSSQDVFYTPKPQHSVKGGSILRCHIASAWASSAHCPFQLFIKTGAKTWLLLLTPFPHKQLQNNICSWKY